MVARLPWARILFVLGAATLVFLAGIAVGTYRLPPFRQLHQAMEALRDLRDNWRHYLGLRSKFVHPATRERGGTTIYDRERAFAGITVISAYRDGQFGVFALDMEGRVVHRWPIDPNRLWPERAAEMAVFQPAEKEFSIQGLWLKPDGSLYVISGDVGIAKLDRCGEPIWSLETGAHHDLAFREDGKLWVVAFEKVYEARPERPGLYPGSDGFYWDELLLLMSDEGEVLKKVSLTDVLYQSGRADILLSGPGSSVMSRDEDPLHNNTVDVLDPELAEAFPMFEPGDILLSFRNVDTILVLDGENLLVKWDMRGPFVGQHDPDFLPNGNILLYDNRMTGETPKLGWSRLIQVDPATREVVWSWQKAPPEGFYSKSQGEQEMLPNGNILTVAPYEGRVIEIEPESGDVVWEWVNLVEPGWVGRVVDVLRFPAEELSFIGRPCPERAE